MQRFRSVSGFLVAAFSLMPAGAWAGDGRIEINQAKALAGQVTPGDAPGFPVTLGVAGSYVLSSDLQVSDANLSGIHIIVDGVTLDLNGFEVAGPVVCTGQGSAVSCGAGSGTGIQAQQARVSVRDGRVRGFGLSGVRVGARAQITNLIVTSNRGSGIVAEAASLVSSSTAYRNQSEGIRVGAGSVVRGCAATRNGDSGIGTSVGSIVLGAAAYENGSTGVGVAEGGVIRENAVQRNERDGIAGLSGTLLSNNGVSMNAIGTLPGYFGIYCFDGCGVQRNGVWANTRGMSLGPETSYSENALASNASFTVVGGVNMGANSCEATVCP